MSGIGLIWAANVKGLKPHTKIVLIQLADFHNKETGRCFPSAKALADECEMDRTTVFRHLSILEERGLITRHSRGDGAGGRASNEYELHLDIVLGDSARHKETSQKTTRGVVAENDGGSGARATTLVAESDTNLNIEPGIEPHIPPLTPQGGQSEFDAFWAEVPKKVGKGDAKKAYRAARKKADAETLLSGMRRYAQERAGKDPQYTKHPGPWLRDERWLDAPVSRPADFHDKLEKALNDGFDLRTANIPDHSGVERLPAPVQSAAAPDGRNGPATGSHDGRGNQPQIAALYRPRRFGGSSQ